MFFGQMANLTLPLVVISPSSFVLLSESKSLLRIPSGSSRGTMKRDDLKEPPGFPGSSAGKESACNTGDPSSIPGSGRSAGEGMGSPLQYSWASLVSQLVKNLPAMQETWVQSLGWEDPLEKGTSVYSSILAWRIPWTV